MKILFALVALNDLDSKVLDRTSALALAFKSRVILTHVVMKKAVVMDMGIASTVIMEEPASDVVEQHRAKLADLGDALAKLGIETTLLQLTGATADSVIDEAAKHRADLIVVGSHQHSTLYNLLIGSVTGEVLKRAKCPVLVVPDESSS